MPALSSRFHERRGVMIPHLFRWDVCTHGRCNSSRLVHVAGNLIGMMAGVTVRFYEDSFVKR